MKNCERGGKKIWKSKRACSSIRDFRVLCMFNSYTLGTTEFDTFTKNLKGKLFWEAQMLSKFFPQDLLRFRTTLLLPQKIDCLHRVIQESSESHTRIIGKSFLLLISFPIWKKGIENSAPWTYEESGISVCSCQFKNLLPVSDSCKIDRFCKTHWPWSIRIRIKKPGLTHITSLTPYGTPESSYSPPERNHDVKIKATWNSFEIIEQVLMLTVVKKKHCVI